MKKEELTDYLCRSGTILLDGAGTGGESYLFRDPVQVLTCFDPDRVKETLRLVDQFVAKGMYVAGYLTYEAGYAFVDLTEEIHETGDPLLWFGIYEPPVVLEASTVQEMLTSGSATRTPYLPPLATPPPASLATLAPPPTCTDLTLDSSREEYEDAVRRVQSLIREGDVYQVNYTGRLSGTLDGNIYDWYRDLRTRQPVAYGAFLQFGSHQVVSLSPEKFFDRRGDLIEMRPMKGTIDRGRTSSEDEWLRQHLHFDEKNRSENLMIVDLIRNDLSVVCLPGSVQTAELYTVESYPTVHQMTSTVCGKLRKEVGYADIFEALFPGGSITGAPKKRAMRRILELENSPRGVYCGAIGFFGPDERASFSVAIRTIVHRNQSIQMGSGGGIIWDSDPTDEHTECLLKASFLSSISPDGPGTELLESILWLEGAPLLDQHLNRLESAAEELGFPFDRTSTEREVRKAADECASVGGTRVDADAAAERSFKIRLLLNHSGHIKTEIEPLEIRHNDVMRIGFSQIRVHSADPFLRVKSTRRTVFDRARREARRRDLDDVLLLNESGHVTEATFYNVFIRRHGHWLTPPVTDGLLPGIGRSEYMRSHPGVIVHSITRDDVLNADEIILTNSVRGVRPAVICET